MAELYSPPDERPWGAVLDKEHKTVIWPAESEVTDGEMKLELSQATLGVGAKTAERNIIELTVMSQDNPDTTQVFTVVSLREGMSEHVLVNLTLNPPVSFRLAAGSGPISLMGVQHSFASQDSSDDDSDDDLGDLVKTESSGKKRKLESPANQAKKSKVVKESPVSDKGDFSKQDTKDAIMKMMKDDDDDSDGGSLDDLDESSGMDSDEDDGKNGLDLGDESLSDASEEKLTKPSPPAKKNKPKKGEKPKPAAKPLDTKQGKAKGAAKSSKVQPAAIEAVKAKIRANKSLPKSEEKFKNYLKSLKVSDSGQVSELWKFVQQIRKP